MWLYVPPTSVSARESAGSTSPSKWCFRTLSRCCTWRTKSLPPRGWWRLWKRGVFDRLPCGRISQPLMQAACEAWWMQSLAGFPVSPTPSQASAKGTTIAAPSGPVSFASLSRSALLWCSSRTSQNLFGTWPLSKSDWNLWATWLRRQHSLRRKRLGRATEESGSSLWPTADANTSSRSNGEFGPNLRELAVAWPTPDGQASQETMDRNARPLNEVATLWGTPRVTSSGMNGAVRESHRSKIEDQAVMWATPNVPSGGRTIRMEHVESRGQTESGKRQVGLEMEARYWRTPSAGHAEKGSSQDPAKRLAGGHTVDLQDQAEWGSFHPDHPTESNGQASSETAPTSRPRLNPMFVSWLMGFPEGWIGCDVSGIPLYLCRLRERLWSCCRE